MGTKLDVTLVEVTDPDELGASWTDLQSRSAHSFFNSWGWIGCWLKLLPARVRPQVLLVRCPTGVVGLGVLCRKRIRRGGVIVSDALFLNETGDPAYDALTIEHNGILADRKYEADVHAAVIEHLTRQDTRWDELFLSGLDSSSELAKQVQICDAGARHRVTKAHPCFVINLAALREMKRSHLDSLSANTRQKLRQSMRLYQDRGPLCIECAHDMSTAWQFYEMMTRLHASYWQSKGQPGAFANSFCDGFYRSLIERRFALGEIQLMYIHAGETPLGYLFNFNYGGRIYSYQSGFALSEDHRLKAGLVSHSLAIQHAIDSGNATHYDFLAGDAQYKRSLSSESHRMEWVALQRDRTRFRVEEMLRKLKRACLSGTKS